MTISHAVATKTIDGTSLGELRIGKSTDGAQRVGSEVVEKCVGVEECEVVLRRDVE